MDTEYYVSQFMDWVKKDPEGKNWGEERKARRSWYRKHLTPKGVKNLTEKDFGHLIKNLWATGIWHNKDYKVKKLIGDNGLDKIKRNLHELLYGNEPTDKRWDIFRKNIKGLGPSSISEILAFFDPSKYAIVNLKPLSLLPALGIISETEIKKISYHNIDGRRYKKILGYLDKVKNVLQEHGLKDADYIDTDFFIAYLFYHVFELQHQRDKDTKVRKFLGIQKEEDQKPPRAFVPQTEKEFAKIVSHEGAELILLKLGKLLGYDTYTPDKSKHALGEDLSEHATLKEIPQFTLPDLMDTIKMIDVIWVEEEFPVACFEVEHTTGVASGLLRLFQLRKLSSGLYIIAPEEVRSKFATEIRKDPFRQDKERYDFRSYEELMSFYRLAESYFRVKNAFLKPQP